ncbi:MAG: hypothetical protein K2M00_02525, partial [Muribaculaceae bacterium]|nr:hypothetical protein [Muribaculaceae bacterium]
MKFIKYSLVALALGVFVAPDASAVIDNPMTQAVIRVYDQQLRANPKDYLTWFRRANEYYRHKEYIQALDDINNALLYAPTGNEDGTRFQAYMLRAGIYNQTGKSALALADLNSAIALEPQSAQAIYQRANTLL